MVPLLGLTGIGVRVAARQWFQRRVPGRAHILLAEVSEIACNASSTITCGHGVDMLFSNYMSVIGLIGHH